ncbi:MAG TPA: GNAT family N-acetyltransferase [Streptosporangiaceae bacterium]
MVLVRPLASGDSRDEYLDLRFRAFGPADSERVWADAEAAIANGSCLAAFDDGRLIGAAMYHDMRQWWLGEAVPLAGVAGVKVAPEYRSKGVGRALMASLIQLMADRGYLLSALYPATSPFYRSLGWELAGAVYEATVPARSLIERPRSVKSPALRRAGPADAAEVIAVLGRAHELARDCGPVTFDEQTVRRWLTAGRWAGQQRYAYLADDGFLAYAWSGGRHEISVDKLVAVSAETTSALWSMVASHASIARTIRVQAAPADPLWWLLREQDAEPAGGYGWMLRVLDARAAIAARGFPAVDIEIPMRIDDDQVAANTGSWMLTVRSGGGSLEPAAGKADKPVHFSVRGLAALYAGTPMAALRIAGLASGGTPESDIALDSAFATTAFMLDTF